MVFFTFIIVPNIKLFRSCLLYTSNAAKRVFSNSQNAEIQKWSHYIKGDVKRQDYLAEALRWICDSKGIGIDAYMSIHRHEPSTGELESYFRSVIDWVSACLLYTSRCV